MKKLNILIKALLLVIVSITCQCAYSQITVVDANDKLPVISASIYNGNGTDVIGITDYDGKLPKAAEQLKSIHIQHINYTPVNIDLQSLKDSTIYLTPFRHILPEVKITKQKDAMLRVKVYVRQMTILNKKPATVSEAWSICISRRTITTAHLIHTRYCRKTNTRTKSLLKGRARCSSL